MALTIGILSVLTVLIPVIWWAWKRNVEPDPQQRLDDLDRRMEELRNKVAVARCHGDDAICGDHGHQCC
jgi:membrane protein implicated in regulation of membrane protease activity